MKNLKSREDENAGYRYITVVIKAIKTNQILNILILFFSRQGANNANSFTALKKSIKIIYCL